MLRWQPSPHPLLQPSPHLLLQPMVLLVRALLVLQGQPPLLQRLHLKLWRWHRWYRQSVPAQLLLLLLLPVLGLLLWKHPMPLLRALRALLRQPPLPRLLLVLLRPQQWQSQRLPSHPLLLLP